MSDLVYDVVVLGAGISGLSAAYYLLKDNPSLSILILEAKDRVGGRTLRTKIKVAGGDEGFCDVGGQWVGPSQRHVAQLIDELELEIYPQYLTGKKIAEMGSQVSQYSGQIPYIGVFGLLDMGKILLQVERYVKQVPIEDPASSRHADYYDSHSGTALINNISYSNNSKCLIAAAIRTIFGAELDTLSSLYMLAYANAAGSFEKLIASDEKSGQGYKIKGGAQQISLLLAERLGLDNIRLSTPVAAIDQSERDLVSVTDISGKVYKAKRLVCTIPWHLLDHVTFTPPLPAAKAHLAKLSPVGHLFKFLITYETAFWRELGYSGEIVSANAAPTAKGCSCAPISVCFDNTSDDGCHPGLVILSGGLQAQELDNLSEARRKESVLLHISRFFPRNNVFNYLDFVEKNWRMEPYNGGCPVNTVCCGGGKLMGPNMRTPFDRIHFAGTETATEWCGFMDGAVQSGKRVASEIITHFKH